MTQTYFANLGPEEIGADLQRKVTEYTEEIERNGRLGLWRKCHKYYYALGPGGQHEAMQIRTGGSNGEYRLLKANHYRNLLQHLHVLVTQQRPVWDCRTVNKDVKSQIQTIIGRNILEYYMREKRLEVEFRTAAEMAIVYSEAYVEADWDTDSGEDVAGDVMTGEVIKAGDVLVRMYDPINTIRQIYADKDQQDWYILRRWEHRHLVAASYPNFAENILAFSAEETEQFFHEDFRQTNRPDTDEDLIPIYTFYHARTKACPTGRKVVFLDDKLVLDYEEARYARLPVVPVIPSRQHGTSFGYSVSFDLLCVQEAVDLIYSTVLTNQATFGVQNVWMKPGTNISTTQLGTGLNVYESNDKPESINLTHTPPEIFNFLKGLETLGEVLSGVNSVARGQPEASLKSGAALALVASQAVQFSNGLQAAFARMLEDTGTLVLRVLQSRAKLPRAAIIAGKNNQSYIREFTGDDLKDINRVIVDLGNPMSRTVAGRIQMAENLLQAQVIRNPEQYIQVIETGSTEPIIDKTRAEELLIDSENEALREGRDVVALAIDRHKEHIESHKSVLAGADERSDPVLVQSVLNHIMEHLNLLRSVEPALLNLLGQAPIATQPMGGPPPPPQGENAPQPNAQPQPGEQYPAPPGSPPEVAAQMPKMPVAAGQNPQQ
jgi:hypothetical protein